MMSIVYACTKMMYMYVICEALDICDQKDIVHTYVRETLSKCKYVLWLGKRVSVAKQQGLNEVHLEQSADGSDITCISFVMRNCRYCRG